MAKRVFSNREEWVPDDPLSTERPLERPLASHVAAAVPERELPEHATPSQLGHIRTPNRGPTRA